MNKREVFQMRKYSETKKGHGVTKKGYGATWKDME